MKKLFSAVVIGCLSGSAPAQVSFQEASQYLTVPGGVQNIDRKVLKDPAPQSLPYIALKFRTASVSVEADGPRNDQTVVRSYAMLDGIDSLLFQEITNEFSEIFIKKLNEAGVTFVDWAKIQESKLYKERLAELEKDPRNFNYKNTGTADVYTQDHRLLWYYPVGGLKGAKFCNETGGGMSYLRLTVDFAEFNVEVNKTYNWGSTTTNWSSQAAPVLKVTSPIFAEGGAMTMATSSNMGGGFTMCNPKNYFVAAFLQQKPIYEPYEVNSIDLYDDKIPKFAAKRRRAFAAAIDAGTFVIEPKKESFKKAALTALTKYADCVAAIIKSYNEEGKKK